MDRRSRAAPRSGRRIFAWLLASLVGAVALACACAVALFAWLAAGAPAPFGGGLTESAGGTDGPALVVDPPAGRVGPARLITRVARYDAAFGPRRTDGGDADWERLGLPGTYPNPLWCRGADTVAAPPPHDVSYDGAVVGVCGGLGYVISVTSRGSRTTAGARIGEPLRAAAARHPGLRCAESTGSTTDPPVPVYRYCSGRVGPGRYLWLGQDPVSAIAIATVPLH